MKASEVLKKPGDVAVSKRARAVATWTEAESRPVRYTHFDDPTYSCYVGSLGGDDWQPLLTEKEWQEKNSFLRKPDPKEEAEHIRLAKELATQTVDHFARAIADVGANTWQPLLANPVGERLTEAPEEGTPVIIYRDSGAVIIRHWRESLFWDSDDRIYLYLGRIPKEPKPKPTLPYPEALKLPGIAGIGFDECNLCWYAHAKAAALATIVDCHEWHSGGEKLFLPKRLFPELYQPPYSDVEAAESWIDNPEYKGGEV